MPVDAHYADPSLAALYDAENGWGPDRDHYLRLSGDTPCTVLEIGCGTGLLARALAARGHRVTAVDPAAAMVDAGRAAPGGAAVRWIVGPAETLALGAAFDLVVMTGHVLEVFPDDAALDPALAAVRRHLAPAGRFAFETRNPARDWAARWTAAHTVDGPDGPVAVERRVESADGGRIAFTTLYRLPGGPRVSRSVLTLRDRAAVEAALRRAGLWPVAVLGGWAGEPFDPAASDDLVVVAGPA